MTESSFTKDDHRFMARALMLAEKGLYSTHPNPRVGCVLVKDGAVIGEGWHQRAGEPHAEVNALQQMSVSAEGATAYVTLEPCCHVGRTPPCSQALIGAKVARVVAAMQDPNPQVAGKGLAQLQGAGIETAEGLLKAQAYALNPGFIQRMSHGRPYVRSKFAMSLDGRTAMASGESKWISSEASRADVQRMRARSCAVLTGSGTVLNDDPSLTVREPVLMEQRGSQPLRVVIDSQLTISDKQQMLGLDGSTLIFHCNGVQSGVESLRSAGAELLQVPAGENGKADLYAVLQALAEREVNELLVEAGSRLNGALLSAGLVDELVVYMAPHLMGSGARGLFDLPELSAMKDRVALDIVEVRQIGPDVRITAKVSSAG